MKVTARARFGLPAWLNCNVSYGADKAGNASRGGDGRAQRDKDKGLIVTLTAQSINDEWH